MLHDLLMNVVADLKGALADFEPERLSGPDADRVLGMFAEIERLAAAGRILAARRVESSNVWRTKGHRSAAAHIAQATGTGMGPAVNTLKTARRLSDLPATEDAVRRGALSEPQAREIAGAASVEPAAEGELLDAAGKQPLNLLKLRCRRVRAVGEDAGARYARIHRERYLRHWTDDDGAVRFDARLTPDAGARVAAAVRAEVLRLAADGRRSGHIEPARALAADALVDLVHRGSGTSGGDASGDGDIGGDHPSGPGPVPPPTGTGPSCVVHVRVDHRALVSGTLEPGEVCEIPGIGPIPVATARSLAGDSILEVLVTKGVDVLAVAHGGRTIPAAVRRALLERDPTCVVPGCEAREALEIDHVVPFVDGGPTTIHNLARLCRWHHYLKTHQRHRLSRRDGTWVWEEPPPPGATGRSPDDGADDRPAGDTDTPGADGTLFDPD